MNNNDGNYPCQLSGRETVHRLWNGNQIHIYRSYIQYITRVDSRLVPSQWEMALLCNNVSHWLGTSQGSALITKILHIARAFCCGLMIVDYTHILQSYFTGTGAVMIFMICCVLLWFDTRKMWICYSSRIIFMYCHTSNIRCTKYQNSNASHLILKLPLPNPLKPVVKSKWRCSWSSAKRWCSNYVWVVNNFIAC